MLLALAKMPSAKIVMLHTAIDPVYVCTLFSTSSLALDVFSCFLTERMQLQLYL